MAWLRDWFIESSKWEETKTSPCSSLVWRNCYGVPLHLWNLETFTEIGQAWGDVILIQKPFLFSGQSSYIHKGNGND